MLNPSDRDRVSDYCRLFKTKYVVSYLVVFILFLTVPRMMNPYLLHVLIYIFLYAFLGISWNIIGGYAGQLSLGHSIFFGIGAYTSTLCFIHFGLTPWIGMVIGALLSTVMGFFIGYLCFRYQLKGPYFALATLAFAEVIRVVVDNMDVIGGAQGLLIPNTESTFYHFQFFDKLPFYYTIYFLTVTAFVISYLIEKTKLGSFLMAIREDEVAAQSLGINSTRYKIIAICISAFLTSLGGTFYAQYVTFINAETVFGLSGAIEIILRPIIGGMGSFLGPVIGSFVLGPLSELTRVFLGEVSGVHLITYGIILIFIILFMPEGLLQFFTNCCRKLLRRKGGDS